MPKKYMIIGAPITKVRTPPMLEDFLRQRGRDAVVEAWHVEPEGLVAFMDEVTSDTSIGGFVVTMPHKKTIIPYLDHLSRAARRVGSVNTIKRTDAGQWVGAQFDGVGLINALLHKNIAVRTAHVLLAGVGGAGMAIAEALAAYGCASLTLIEPDAQHLQGAVDMLRHEMAFSALETQQPKDVTYDLLINATPLGMKDDDPSPFSASLVEQASWIADIVADPPETRLAAMALEAGRPLVTGRDMVRGQIEPIGNWLLSSEVEQ